MNKTKTEVDSYVEENNGSMVGTNHGIIYCGMNYVDVRSLCLDLIREEISKAKDIALIEAKKRDDELVSQILKKAADANISPDDIMVALQEPALQFDFIEAEKAYIKYGTAELKELLSDLVVKRIEEPGHNLLQIVLGEAIKTAPLLLPSQINSLGLKFVLTHTKRTTVVNYQTLLEYLNQHVVPIYEKGISEKQSEFQHLSYVGCATTSIGSSSLESVLLNTYTGLFFKGFDEESLKIVDGEKSNILYPTLFTKCLNDNKKLQINAIDEETVKELFEKLKVKQSHQDYILSLFKSNRMNAEEVRDKVIETCPKMEQIFKYWNDSLISRLTLSSVGIIIGAFAAQNITNDYFKLSIWI
ncbi:MAG: hypothetical protein IJX00_04695 [Clostridia bacterium]|nr:hypothetical protein [Clostridia bacterium]